MTQPDNDPRELCGCHCHFADLPGTHAESACYQCAAIREAEARVHDRWTREVQHRFDTCEARHVDEWRAFAVKMGVVLKP